MIAIAGGIVIAVLAILVVVWGVGLIEYGRREYRPVFGFIGVGVIALVALVLFA